MATYGEKVREYEARVRKAIELEQEPKKKHLDKLYYYVGRAERKGADHKTKWKDKFYWMRKSTQKTLRKSTPDLLKAAVAIAAGSASSPKELNGRR
jgi:hypothetical protein